MQHSQYVKEAAPPQVASNLGHEALYGELDMV
jgi:hypothetical protein